ncbi:uncharacterized protein LOC127865300 [Dreissena polymorpha]|nr:uncharacterized protein LOC127865300 [Dreissena polymorpha]
MMADITTLCLILGIASFLSIDVFGFEKRCFRNDSDPIGVFTLVLRQNYTADFTEQILALNALNGPSSCKSNVVVLPTTDVNELIIKYNISAPLQIYPSDTCHVQYTSPDIFTVYVAVQQDPAFIQVSDKFYSATCNTSDVDPGFIELGPLDITNNKEFESAKNRTSNVTMELIDAVTGIVTTAPILGQLVCIRITYYFDDNALASEYPRGLHNFDLTVGPDSGSPLTTTLVLDNGCLPGLSNIFGLNGTFIHNSAISGVGFNVFETGYFIIVMFQSSNQLHITLRYSAECYDESENKCFNQRAYCTSLSGRKRRAIDRVVNGSNSIIVNIGLPGQSTTAQNVGPVNNINAHECVADNTYWILAVVLGIALLIVTMVTMYIFCRVRSQQQDVDRISEKSGFKNPAF